jgi:hypothetical protein
MQGSGQPVDIVEHQGTIIGFVMTARDRCNMLVKPGFEALTPLRQWEDPKISKDNYRIKHMGTYMVPAKNGASLATELWLP